VVAIVLAAMALVVFSSEQQDSVDKSHKFVARHETGRAPLVTFPFFERVHCTFGNGAFCVGKGCSLCSCFQPEKRPPI
jgi:hypothetical protein